MKRKKKRENPIKRILPLLFILIITLIILLIINFKAWGYFSKKEIVMIDIPDECSWMVGTILHNIKDDAGCENSCRAQCYILEKNYYDSDFTRNETSCNECKCYCK